ncbi:RagB/SusD family nutrient uptake outer membrane protein [Proteiniphilum sp. UBA5384]|uniref:RagB/SusD family nutrient uptake outer membrane protein n=1 Tax=Proteiniphilum sp. UBA5384 TaxID=1947279 RepID=UPI0025CB9BC6|nr:RagB/SusD family nutrient uptake outer membrane protein [Proteiniphilum sp. UBA5384]
MKRILFYICLVLTIFSCDFLDVVPEGQATLDDLFRSEKDCEKFVYYMYHNIPTHGYWNWLPDMFAGGDLMTGRGGTTRWYNYKSMLYGDESANQTYYGMWAPESSGPTGKTNYEVFKGIRYAYILLDNIDRVPNISDANHRQWRGEAYWLIAYYHQVLLDFYGPVTIQTKAVSLNATELDMYPIRAPYDECVNFIADMWDEAANLLPPTRNDYQLGRATSVSALAYKSRLLLHAASPQYNGNTADYADFKNPDGTQLMSLTYDKEKWERARKAAMDAIQLAESNGYILYENQSITPITEFEQGVKNYHDAFCETIWNEKEFFFSGASQTGIEAFQRNSAPRFQLPYSTDGFRNQVTPTFYMLKQYYTKNGLPLDVDPLTAGQNLYQVAAGDSTALFHRDREPRFYANVGYDRGEYDINGTTIILKMRKGETHGSTGNTAHEYQSPTGYLNKKYIHKQLLYNPSDKSISYRKLVFPYIRLAELYLNYAEADFEYNGALSAQSLGYINKIRSRSRLPKFEDSWALVGGIPTGKNLQKVIRQERTIELTAEGRLYHDSRRWGIAKDIVMANQEAWNLEGTTQSAFYTLSTMPESGVRNFVHPQNIWLAFPLDQLNVNYNLVQNPGY